MSDADSAPRRRPPTIDLTAKEVDTGTPGAAPASEAKAAHGPTDQAVPGGRSGLSGATTPYAIGGVVGALAAAAIIAGLWISGLVPVRQAAAPQTAAASPSPTAPGAPGARTADNDDISARLDKIQQALQAQRPDAALEGRLTAAEARTKALGDSLAALTRRVDDVAAASQAALAQAKAAAVAAEAAKNAAQAGAQRADLDPLANRIVALENAVKSLSAEVAQRTSSSTADDRATRLTVAAEALRAAVERGAPYQAELGAVTALGADPSAAAMLAPFAAQGVPGAAQLGHELAALAPALYRAVNPAPSGNSFLARLESHAQQLVRITPIGTSAVSADDDPSSVIALINAAAARGDVAAALADITKLPDAPRALAGDWVKKAQVREAAIAASRRIAADALAALSKPGSQ
jgi:hypothetical protein